MATHSSILTWEILWIEEPGGYSPWGCKRVGYVTRVYVPRFFVSSQQRFRVTDIKAPLACHSSKVLDRQCITLRSQKDRVIDKSVLQLSVIALFYLKDNQKIHL